MLGFVMGFEGGSVSALTNVFVQWVPEVGSSYKEGSVAAGPTGPAFIFALPVTDALSASSSRHHPLHCFPHQPKHGDVLGWSQKLITSPGRRQHNSATGAESCWSCVLTKRRD